MLRPAMKRRRIRLIVAGLAALPFALVGADSAAAIEQVQRAGQFLPLGWPTLAGGGAVWAEYRNDGGYVLRRAQGGATRTVRVRRNRRRGHIFRLALAGSTTAIASEETFLHPGADPRAIGADEVHGSFVTGSRGAALRIAPRCPFQTQGRSTDADDEMVVARTTCTGDAAVRRVGDSAVGRTVTGRGDTYRLAGRYLAYRAQDQIVVSDWTTGLERYRIRIPSERYNSFFGLDVQRDGTVAYAYYPVESPSTGTMRVGYASAAEPFHHPAGLPPRGHYAVKLVNGTLVSLGNPQVKPFGPEGGTGELRVSGLRDTGRVVASEVLDDSATESFDFDGSNVVYATAGCRGPRVIVRAAGSAAPAARSGQPCPLRLSGRLRLGRERHIVGRVSCRGLTRSCRASRIILTVRRSGRDVVIARPRVARGGQRFRARLTPGAARLLRRGRGRAKISAGIRDRSLSRSTRRSAKVRVRTR